MREEIANLVDPILEYGLSLRERLEAGAALNLDSEQATLQSMLFTESAARRWPDYGGDLASEHAFHGSRYALTCWLDELFLRYSPWEGAWSQRTLETTLYGGMEPKGNFWQQAQHAEARPGTDALEVFYLCVMLGFRGEWRESPKKLRDWIATTQARLAQHQQDAWQLPPELEPATHVPPLRGREKMQRMIFVGGLILLVLIPFVVSFVARNLAQ